MGQLFLAQLGAMGAQELAKLAGCPDWVQELIAFGVGVTIYSAGDAFFMKIGDTSVAIPESTAREISEKTGQEIEGVSTGDISKMTEEQLKPHSLSNFETRKWYLEQESKIPNLIDKTQSLEDQARQAFNLRNKFRTEARELMENQNLAQTLNDTDPNMTWDEIIKKYESEGLNREQLWNKIIEKSQDSRQKINDEFGL